MPDELSFDALAERGQYRAFQRAYGKENQAMLGLIFLTVAWSYAAHVYGHATVFNWFTRYSILGVLIYLLFCGLRYAHGAFEKVAQHYSQLKKEHHNAQREERAREKARERRRRAKEMQEVKPGADSDKATTTTTWAAPAAQQPSPEPPEDAPKECDVPDHPAAVPVLPKEQAISEHISEVAETQSTASTQPSTTKKQACHDDRKKCNKRTSVGKGGDQKAYQKTADAKPSDQKTAEPKPSAIEAATTESSKLPEARNPEVETSPPLPIPSVSELIASVNELKNNIDIQTAEDRVALAKKQALRAHEQMRAQQVAMQDRERAASVDEGPRNSLKGLLRPSATGQVGYIPPHLREGYTPKPANAQMPRSFEGRPSRTTAVAKKASKPFNPAPVKPLARQAGGVDIPIPLPKPVSKESFPASSKSSSLRSSPNVSPDQVKEADGVAFHPVAADQMKESKAKKAPAKLAATKKAADSIQSKNVFMLLPDDDGDSDLSS